MRCQCRRLAVFACAAVALLSFIYLMTRSSNRTYSQRTNSTTVTASFKSQKIHFGVKDDVSAKNTSLKYGFQWLREQHADDPIVIDSNTTEAFLEHLVFTESKTLEITCPKRVRMGRVEDGGWDVCVAGPYNIVKPCLVYSIGMGGEWSFDNMITSSKYECYDFAYDPTIGKPDHKPNARMWFYNTGLGGKDEVKKIEKKVSSLKTFPFLLHRNNHTNVTIDILKMDIEYSEWDALEVMLANQSCLANVKQLMVEFHTREIASTATSSREELTRYWRILRGIYHLGFKLWNVWNNPTCNFRSKRTPKLNYCGCFNMYFVNVKYLDWNDV